ncbi:hypothetical protein JHK87_018436 [Glycine soja]|nr:hypothetical protein JHK87_018436 [Glycine soja]
MRDAWRNLSCPLLCDFASRALYCFQPPLFDEAPPENSKNTEKTMCSQCTPLTKVSVTNKVRKVDMLEGVSVVRSEKVNDELILDGNDIELVSRSCTLIN